jgi:hypothetical protein
MTFIIECFRSACRCQPTRALGTLTSTSHFSTDIFAISRFSPMSVTEAKMSATAAPAKKKKSETGTGGAKAGAGAGAGAAAEKEKPATETIHNIEEKTKNLVKSDSSAGAAALGFLELKEDSKVTVPNVASKLSDKEQARLQAQIGNLQKVGAIFVVRVISGPSFSSPDRYRRRTSPRRLRSSRPRLARRS